MALMVYQWASYFVPWPPNSFPFSKGNLRSPERKGRSGWQAAETRKLDVNLDSRCPSPPLLSRS